MLIETYTLEIHSKENIALMRTITHKHTIIFIQAQAILKVFHFYINQLQSFHRFRSNVIFSVQFEKR